MEKRGNGIPERKTRWSKLWKFGEYERFTIILEGNGTGRQG